MLSLNDVLPRHERVDIGTGKIDIFGISGEDIGEILRRYPNAFQQMADSGSQSIKMDPGLMGALLAASQRNPEGTKSFLGDEKTESLSRALGAADQNQVMKVIGRCTFPDGVGPFLEDLQSMSESTLEAMEVVVRVSSRGQATASPPKPKPSDAPSTQPSGS
jgi:hypothetical protein